MKALKNMSRKERKLHRAKLHVVAAPAKVIALSSIASVAQTVPEWIESHEAPLSEMERAKAVFDRFPKGCWPLRY